MDLQHFSMMRRCWIIISNFYHKRVAHKNVKIEIHFDCLSPNITLVIVVLGLNIICNPIKLFFWVSFFAAFEFNLLGCLSTPWQAWKIKLHLISKGKNSVIWSKKDDECMTQSHETRWSETPFTRKVCKNNAMMIQIFIKSICR